jgi:hypothetical protein
MARDLLSPDRLRQSEIFNPSFVRQILVTPPHQRLRWHYFMLWQMVGVEIWRETFVASGAYRGPKPVATRTRGTEGA